MPKEPSIPAIDVSALFGPPCGERERTDGAIADAAATVGFFVAHGFPAALPVDPRSRTELLRLFQLPERETRPLWRQKFDPSHANVYRGWFPPQRGFLTR
jgi:isopenicillin N synthase-like dioxygenase